jgi:hypothetical protein
MRADEVSITSWQGTLAPAFVDGLNRRWKGRVAYDDPRTVIDAIELLSAPADGPMVLRVRFTMDGQPGEWRLTWEDVAWRSLADAVAWFGQVVWETFAEVRYTSYQPDGFRLAAS